MKTIVNEVPGKEKDIKVLEIDVSDDASVLQAAKTLRERNVKLYGLVNNAGVLKAEDEVIMNTNYHGPKRVTDAFVDLVDRNKGRIVNTRVGLGFTHPPARGVPVQGVGRVWYKV